MRRRCFVLGVLFACVAVVGTAGAAPSTVDLAVNVGAADTNERAVLSPNGTTIAVTKRDFWVFVGVSLATVTPAGATVRAELDQGLGWGADAPDRPEGCTSTTTTGQCEVSELRAETGSAAVYFWNVTAAQNGTYTFRAELVATSDTDGDFSNNSASVTIVVTEQAGGGGGDGGGTFGAASAAKLMPKPVKAGSVVTASVRTTSAGTPVRPTGVRCTGTIGKAKVRGIPRAQRGTASCKYRTPVAAKGKMLRGTISLTLNNKRFVRRFATRLT